MALGAGQRLALDTPVQYVKGVGPHRAESLAALGVRTVGELLEYLPFRHEVVPRSVAIGDLELGGTATVVGELRRIREAKSSRQPTVSAQVVDGTGECRVRWFHSPYLVGRFHAGQVIRLSGRVEVLGERAAFSNPDFVLLEDEEDPWSGDTDRFEPVYPASAKLASRQIARIVRTALSEAGPLLPDHLPGALRQRRQLPPRSTAILRFHLPTQARDVEVARGRLAYDELLLCQLAVQWTRQCAADGPPAEPIHVSDAVDERIRRRFPFQFTAGQNRAVQQIRDDLARTVPMNRLLQADVGAGKTAVAMYAALAAIAARKQVALLAPTAVLAEQHDAKARRYLDGSRVRLAYLSGSTPRGQRAECLSALGGGQIDLLVGTHAVLEPDVVFADLGLVIIDEQHKFGVAQRGALRAKGRSPHTLALTATPIPRTLAMTLYGALDVSTMEDAPPQRQNVVTRLVASEEERKAWDFVRSRLAAGERAYVIYPLVEESDDLPLKAVTVERDRLARTDLRGYESAILHGRMTPGQKSEVMERFRRGDVQALVATTVVEVGVDVPEATVMVIEHAARYGLSQLHQLRGRIGRGTRRSYCLLFAGSSEPTTCERLRILCATSDGFRIAEEDLRLRGPGEWLGTRQHGLPAFKVADPARDLELLVQARDDAREILTGDPALRREEHQLLRAAVLERYGKVFDFVDA